MSNVDDKKSSGVRFAQETVLVRELPNRVWKTAVAHRNGPRWIDKYRHDCTNCNIKTAASLGALVAATGYTAYHRQTAARELLAGKQKWPTGSTMDIVKAMSTNEELLPLWSDIFDDLITSIIEDGIGNACESALERIAMVTVNHEQRKAVLHGGESGGDGGGGSTCADANGGGVDEGAPMSQSVGKLLSFIEGNVKLLEMEIAAKEQDGWDGADGWFVLEDEFAAKAVGKASATPLVGVSGPDEPARIAAPSTCRDGKVASGDKSAISTADAPPPARTASVTSEGVDPYSGERYEASNSAEMGASIAGLSRSTRSEKEDVETEAETDARYAVSRQHIADTGSDESSAGSVSAGGRGAEEVPAPASGAAQPSPSSMGASLSSSLYFDAEDEEHVELDAADHSDDEAEQRRLMDEIEELKRIRAGNASDDA
jgi:hypothetical protein